MAPICNSSAISLHRPLATTSSTSDGQSTAYVLQLAPLSAHQPLSWAYSTSDPLPRVNILQLQPSSSTFTSVAALSTSDDGRGRITELKNPTAKPDCLLAGFSNASVLACWDLRSSQTRPSLELRGSTTSPFLSCDLSAAGTVLAAGSGTEHEARIELFDLRAAPTPLHAYTESHSDLVTTVAFHPTLDDRLLSGSADGLLATYDVRLSDEDEALIATGNVEASVARVRWTPDGRSIWASTDMETLSLWNSEDLSLVENFGDIRQGHLAKPHSSWTQPTAYLIDCATLPIGTNLSTSRSGYFSGSQAGEVSLMDTSSGSGGKWRVAASLTDGHTDIVRAAIIDQRNEMMLTGGEDGRVCLWSSPFDGTNQTIQPSSGPDGRARKTGTEAPGTALKDSRYKPY